MVCVTTTNRAARMRKDVSDVAGRASDSLSNALADWGYPERAVSQAAPVGVPMPVTSS